MTSWRVRFNPWHPWHAKVRPEDSVRIAVNVHAHDIETAVFLGTQKACEILDLKPNKIALEDVQVLEDNEAF